MASEVPPTDTGADPGQQEHAEPEAAGRAALTRELSDFLIELSIGLHKYAMYPEGHPTLGPAVSNVGRRLDDLLSLRTSLSLGVAKQRLVIEGVATDSTNPVLKDLATRLHAHQLGAITFLKGVTNFELQQFLKSVATDPNRSGEPLGTGPSSRRDQQPHIQLFPIAYDRLRLMGDDVGPDDEESKAARTRADQLWVGLARAAMAIDELTDDGEHTDAEPSLVARAIRDRQQDSAYDQVIVGYLLQIADELKQAGGSDALALKARIDKLIGSLDRLTLRRLLQMGGSDGQRRKFLYDANQGMSPEAVVKLVDAASQNEGQTVSDSLLRILQKLAHHAEYGTSEARDAAEQSMRDQIADLIESWSLKDPNPDDYTIGLKRMAEAAPERRIAVGVIQSPESERIVQMALEVNVSGTVVLDAVNDLVQTRRVGWLMDTMDDVDAGDVKAAIWKDLSSAERLNEIITADAIDVEALDSMLPKVGAKGAEPMLEELMAAESRQKRRILLDRLIGLGHAVAPLAVARLADSRWYVQRNMLSIIGELTELPEGFRPADFFEHPDHRVRREALRITLQHAKYRERALCRAIADEDDQTVRMGLTAAAKGCPKAAVSLVISRAMSHPDDDMRVAAVRVLGSAGDASATGVLIKLTEPRKRLFGTRLPPKTKVYLEALRALRDHQDNPRARAALIAAAQSKDPEIAAAAVVRPGNRS